MCGRRSSRSFPGRGGSQGSPKRDRHGRHEPEKIFLLPTAEDVPELLPVDRNKSGHEGNLEGPEVCADYSPGYYAFFFEDPDGNKLEICCRESPIIAQ